MIRENDYKRGAEIGVWKGAYSTHILTETAVDKLFLIDSWDWFDNMIWLPERKLYMHEAGQTPDTFEDAYRETQAAMKPFAERAEIIRKRSPEAATLFANGTLDFVYIDAIHYYEWVKADILAWLPKVRVGGKLVGDDWDTMFPDVSKAITELFAEYHVEGRTWWVDR